jgi:putative IMPACT (imprinted ancient) family translation regulator
MVSSKYSTAPMTNDGSLTPLCELRVADSIFLGYVLPLHSNNSITKDEQIDQEQQIGSDVFEFRRRLIRSKHCNAAHAPWCALLHCAGNEGVVSSWYDDDGEPESAGVGQALLHELKQFHLANANNNDCGPSEEDPTTTKTTPTPPATATSVIIVRYFGTRHLGVTCGRLTGVYARTARLALHRHTHGHNVPFVECWTTLQHNSTMMYGNNNLYGLGSGDCELLLNVVTLESLCITREDNNDKAVGREDESHDNNNINNIIHTLLHELKFEAMVGSANEPLPRLQNLQADYVNDSDFDTGSDDNFATVVPVYRYPGNYSGIEFPTHK